MGRDEDIESVEARIVRRRHDLSAIAHETEQRAMRTLSSPGFLAGAAVLGFLVGGGAVRRHHESSHRSGRRRGDPAARKAKRTGVLGALTTGAMWLVRARFGSAAGLAQYLMARRQAATRPSHRPLR
jgi:hypothetical protein